MDPDDHLDPNPSSSTNLGKCMVGAGIKEEDSGQQINGRNAVWLFEHADNRGIDNRR